MISNVTTDTYKMLKAPLPAVDFRNRKLRLMKSKLQKEKKIRIPKKLDTNSSR